MDNFREDPNEFISRQGSHLSLSFVPHLQLPDSLSH